MTMFSFNVQSIFILILFNIYFIGNTIASAHCRRGEYRVGEECCPSCAAGMHVIENCTEFTGTSCAPCREGSYQDHINGRKQCFPCRKCDAGLKVKRSSTATSDALCEVLDGYFCVDSNRGGCIAAQRHLACCPGQYISQRGTADKDTECLQCPDGTFSNGTITSCQPHTKCESVGLKLIQPGSDSTDFECAEDSNITLVLLVIGVTAVVGVILGLIVWTFKRARTSSRQKQKTPRKCSRSETCDEIPMEEQQTTLSSDKSSGNPEDPTYIMAVPLMSEVYIINQLFPMRREQSGSLGRLVENIETSHKCAGVIAVPFLPRGGWGANSPPTCPAAFITMDV